MIDKSAFPLLPFKFDDNRIVVTAIRHHKKASEAYLDVIFHFPNVGKLEGSVPVNYRRTGIDAQSVEDCIIILKDAYASFESTNVTAWSKQAEAFWNDSKKDITRPFFDVLLNNLGKWVCQGCQLPTNPNWARRTQDIKEFGFTFATNTSVRCPKCGGAKTHLMLLPLMQGAQTGYETISSKLMKRIVRVFGCYDAYEDRRGREGSLLADHKFHEIRWDEDTKEKNVDDMGDREICEKFQLITNQRNEQKREACRTCYQTGRRGSPFGIQYFYKGDSKWPNGIPKRGKKAESGCCGCGWHDLSLWRESLNKHLAK